MRVQSAEWNGEYGSDRNGLVWGYRFDAKGTTAISAEEATQQLARGEPTDAFCWLHFSLANAASERWLRQSIKLLDSFYEALHATSGSTRIEQDGDALVVGINDVLSDFHSIGVNVSSMALAVRPGVIVSARLKPVRSVDRLRETVRAGAPVRSPVSLLARLLQNQADVLIEVVRKSNETVDDIEDRVLTSPIPGHRAQLSSIRRMLVRLQRLLAPEPAALFRLLSRPPTWVTHDDVDELRRSAEEFSAAVADCVTLVERAKLVQEELAAMVNEQTNRSLFLLTFVTVLFLPFNVTGALFGMNVGGIPFGQSPLGFWTIVVIVTALTLVVARWLWGQFRS